MPNSKSQIAVFLVLAGVLGALVFRIVVPRRPPTAVPEPTQAKLSQQIDLDVYVDGSGSMKNFLKAGKGGGVGTNFLQKFLKDCEDTFTNPPATGGWNHPPGRFWRFGAKVTRLGTGDLRHLADNPDGYREPGKPDLPGFIESRTLIQLPIDHQPQEPGRQASELKIIVTDLYQSNAANESLVNALTARYLTDTGAVAIYGIRNPYTGPVEDLPALQGKSLAAGAADSMPFYILIAGDNAADVYHAQEVLMTDPRTGSWMQTAFSQGRAFAMYFGKDPGWRASSEVGEESGSVRIDWRDPQDPKKKLGVGPKLQEHFHDSIPLLTIVKGKVRATFSMPKEAVERTGEETAVGEGLETRTLAYSTRPGGKSEEDRNAERAVEAALCEDGRSVCATFDRRRLRPAKGKYLFQFDVYATRGADVTGAASEKMQPWNIEDAEETHIASTQPSVFPRISGVAGLHPGRTPNLSQVLTALQNRLFEVKDTAVDPVRVATYNLYVEAK